MPRSGRAMTGPAPRSRRRAALSDATVKSHIARILAKLGLRDRVQVVVLAYETGIARPGETGQTAPPSRTVSESAATASRRSDHSFACGPDGPIRYPACCAERRLLAHLPRRRRSH